MVHKVSVINARNIELNGTKQFFLTESHRTQGQALVLEMVMPPGSGIASHTHKKEDESFYVLSGQLRMKIEGEGDLLLSAGDFAFAPRGQSHALACEGSQELRMIGIAFPGENIAGMYDMIEQAQAKGNVTLEELADICARFEITFDL